MSVAIALFTRNLRVHDNPVLHAACHAAREVVPLFVLDGSVVNEVVRRYLPELQDVRGPAVPQPWKLNPSQRANLDYPDPIIDLRDGADHFRAARDKTGGEQ
ncbi:MAG: deoxyribodipyrimidine photo-lyase [Pseudonocardiaceae bacterium]